MIGGFSAQVREVYKSINKLDSILNIIDFTQSPSGLNMKLYPAQKFIFKLFYKIPLETNLQEPIIIRDGFNENVVETFYNEIDFFNFLHAQKKVNMSFNQWNDLQDNIRAIDFICGRRASKSTMTSIITLYQIYMLLAMENPHDFFNLANSSVIGIQICSNKKDSAFKLFKSISTIINQSKFFKGYVSAIRAEQLWLATQSYKDEQAQGVVHSNLGNILISSASASPKLRGDSNLLVILDEIAHLRDSDTKTKDEYSDSEVYEALMPSTWGFVGMVNGKPKGFGKCFVLSSPNGKKGLLYERYKNSFNDTQNLMINTPSNWINPNLDSAYIKELFNQNEMSYKQEFLAEFVDFVGSYIDKDKLYACFDLNNSNEIAQRQGNLHFVGVDLGLANDRTAIAICHIQSEKPNVRYYKAEYEAFSATQGDYYVIDCVIVLKPNKKQTLKIENVIEVLSAVYTKFKVYNGSFDQFSGQIFEQIIAKTPIINPLKLEPATAQTNNDRAVLLKRLINEGRVFLPYSEDIARELLSLQSEFVANGLVKVHNPHAHDDIYSAISRAVELAYRYKTIRNETYIANFKNVNTSSFNNLYAKNRVIKNSTGNYFRDLKLGKIK